MHVKFKNNAWDQYISVMDKEYDDVMKNGQEKGSIMLAVHSLMTKDGVDPNTLQNYFDDEYGIVFAFKWDEKHENYISYTYSTEVEKESLIVFSVLGTPSKLQELIGTGQDFLSRLDRGEVVDLEGEIGDLIIRNTVK